MKYMRENKQIGTHELKIQVFFSTFPLESNTQARSTNNAQKC